MGQRGLGGALATAAVLLMVGAGSASAATLTVTTTQDERTPGDGQCSLREAIAAVDAPTTATDCGTADNAGNTIALGPTTYSLSIHPSGGDDNSTGDLDVQGTTNLTITGVGAGATMISGTGLQDRLLSVISGAVTLRNLTLSNGHAPDGAAGVDTNISGLVATAGHAGSDGGAVSNAGTLTLDDVAITNGSAGNGGRGGNGGPLSLSTRDGAAGGNAGRGGGIYNAATGSLTLTNATMTGNRSGNGGSGGQGAGGTNGAGGAGGCCGDGGGLFNDGGHVEVRASTLTQNIAGDGGAGGNGGPSGTGQGGTGQGGSSGGAIATVGGTVSIANSTIAGNLSGRGGNGGDGGFNPPSPPGPGGNAGNGSGGGGIFAGGGATVTLASVTIAQNQSGGSGTPGTGTPNGSAGLPAKAGGVYDPGAAVNAQDTLFAENGAGNCGGTPPTDGGHNLSFGDPPSCPSTFANGDPRLGSLQDNGGPTQTMALHAGSAAIDQVPASGAGCQSTDQRGAARPSGPACDIGAYELTAPSASTGPASSITSSTATLSGSVTPNQSSASVRFEYGTTTSYGSTTPIQQLGGFSPNSVSAPIAGLAPKTTYHYRLVATSSDGSAVGGDRTFTTAPATAGAPKLAHVTIKPSVFRAAKRKHHRRDKTGTTLSYTDSQAAKTTLTVWRCTKVKKRRCVRYARVGSFSHIDRTGRNSFHWNGRVGRHRLSPGRYRLDITAHLGRLSSRAIHALFRIVR